MSAVTLPTASAPLVALPAMLRTEPALTVSLGRRAGVVAVPEAARALTIAGLAHLSERRPFVVVTPTGKAAGRLFDDLQQYLPSDEVAMFPAWETLPFERVSPSVETMGRRLEVLWRLREVERSPKVVVASVRSLLQRLGPHVEDVEPVIVRPASQLDPDALLTSLVAMGYRREELVEH